MKIISFCLLLSAFCSAANAQGFLPPQSTSTVSSSEASHPLLIGEKVPESLTVTDENGKKRTLLSYKSPLEVLVVTFFSARCSAAQAEWPQFRQLNERYKDWRVAFVAVSSSAREMLPELSGALKREKLPWSADSDDQRAAVGLLKITGTPEVLVIDEYGVLKYRGPVVHVRNVLDTVIGHLDAVQEPEPPFEGKCAL